MQDNAVFCQKCGTEVSATSSKDDVPSPNDGKQPPKGTGTKKTIYKQWWFWVIIAVAVLTMFTGLLDSGDQGSGSASSNSSSNATLGDYNVVIESCRLAADYQGKPVVIVKYKFTNNGDEPASFMFSLNYNVFQNGVGLNQAVSVPSAFNYSSDNMTKELQKGASLYVEVAYILNDETTDVVVEVSEFASFNNKKITKTFSIN